MKLLLRQHEDQYYVWKDGYTKGDEYYVQDKVHGDFRIRQYNILAIKDDERNGYVACAYCGTIIKNTPEDIEKHFAEVESEKDCARCEYLRITNRKDVNSTIQKNADGTWTWSQTKNGTLHCGRDYWNGTNIDSTKIKKICPYYLCRNNGVTQIKDVFIQYPDTFSTQLTVDVLNKKKCVCEGFKHGFFEYDLKCRGTIKACVNELGIVDHFKIMYRYNQYNVYYSQKYDILFYADNTKYNIGTPYGITDAKMNQAREKIIALYKEATGNE